MENNNLKDKQLKVIFSSGIGKLHLVEAAMKFKKYSPDTKVILITSWIPSLFSLYVLRNIGLGKIAKRLSIRRDAAKIVDSTVGLLLPELTYHILKKIIGSEKSLGIGFKIFGILSSLSLVHKFSSNTILHLRSGGGYKIIKKARKLGVKIIVDHSIAHPLSFKDYLGFENPFLDNKTLSTNSLLWKQVINDCDSADQIIVNSDFVKKTFIDKGYSSEKLSVVYLGLPERFNKIERKYNSDKPSLSLLFTGHFDIRKGIDLIVRVMKIFEENNPNICLNVAGNISDSGKAVLNELGNPSNIIFHGYLNEKQMDKMLAESDAFIFPTYIEGCSRSVMEAMSAGLPVITTPQSGAPIINMENGVELENRSPEIWAETILGILSNFEYSSKISKAGRKKLKYFTDKKYVELLLLSYKAVI